MIFRTELIKNRKYIPLAKNINRMAQDNGTTVFHLASHQYEWAKNELKGWESYPGIFEHNGVKFSKRRGG